MFSKVLSHVVYLEYFFEKGVWLFLSADKRVVHCLDLFQSVPQHLCVCDAEIVVIVASSLALHILVIRVSTSACIIHSEYLRRSDFISHSIQPLLPLRDRQLLLALRNLPLMLLLYSVFPAVKLVHCLLESVFQYLSMSVHVLLHQNQKVDFVLQIHMLVSLRLHRVRYRPDHVYLRLTPLRLAHLLKLHLSIPHLRLLQVHTLQHIHILVHQQTLLSLELLQLQSRYWLCQV